MASRINHKIAIVIVRVFMGYPQLQSFNDLHVGRPNSDPLGISVFFGGAGRQLGRLARDPCQEATREDYRTLQCRENEVPYLATPQ